MAAPLSVEEREFIAVHRAQDRSMRWIAGRLGRAPSTISREIRERSIEWFSGYQAVWAQRDAELMRRRARPAKLAAGPLRQLVIQQLNLRWSPRQIAVWLRLEYPDQPELHVSHESIYQAIYVQSRGRLRDELKHQKALRSGRTRRRAHPAGPVASHRPWLGLHISQRPAEADDRAVPGHWEGDLLMGKGNASAIATLVERSTRFVILVALPGGKLSEHVAGQLTQAMACVPERLRRSLAWDQGSEMARHTRFSLATGCPVYFCDPHSPWQRGSNENTNGLLRDYFPVSHTNFHTIDQTELDRVADELNTRIRQTLNWQTPAAKLAELLTVASVD